MIEFRVDEIVKLNSGQIFPFCCAVDKLTLSNMVYDAAGELLICMTLHLSSLNSNQTLHVSAD